MKGLNGFQMSIVLLVASVLFGCGNGSSIPVGQECKEDCKKQASIESIQFENDFFYDEDGVFIESKAKDALIAMLEYHNYPVFEGLRENIWVTDYNAGRYTEVGLASITHVNNVEDQYMLMDIFLLPGQMLAEHWHLPAEGNPAKREGWLVRSGKSYIVGVGEDNRASFPEVVVPEIHWGGKVETNHVIEGIPGRFVPLAEVESRHWQMAGPEGAIITEVANVHTGAGVKRSDPKMN